MRSAASRSILTAVLGFGLAPPALRADDPPCPPPGTDPCLLLYDIRDPAAGDWAYQSEALPGRTAAGLPGLSATPAVSFAGNTAGCAGAASSGVLLSQCWRHPFVAQGFADYPW